MCEKICSLVAVDTLLLSLRGCCFFFTLRWNVMCGTAGLFLDVNSIRIFHFLFGFCIIFFSSHTWMWSWYNKARVMLQHNIFFIPIVRPGIPRKLCALVDVNNIGLFVSRWRYRSFHSTFSSAFDRIPVDNWHWRVVGCCLGYTQTKGSSGSEYVWRQG